MRRLIIVSVVNMFFVCGMCQQPDTLIRKLDSLSSKTDSAGGQINNINDSAYNSRTRMTGAAYLTLLVSDLKQEIAAPFHFRKHDWGKVTKIVLIGGGLAFADEPLQRYASKLRTNNQSVRSISKFVTNFGGLYEGYTLAALGTYGLIFKNEKIKTTTLLATQAYITGAVMEGFLKFVTGRRRPIYYDPTSDEAEPYFHGPFHGTPRDITGKRISPSFPSGHTTVAFAAATVFALEYKDKPLIPVIAYSAATLIGLSRITENKHWITDVFAGAVLGYFTGKQVVNNYHRYAKLRAPQIKKNSVAFNMSYFQGNLLPGFVYRFR